MRVQSIWMLLIGPVLSLASVAAPAQIADLAVVAPVMACEALPKVDLASATGAPTKISTESVGGSAPYCRVAGTVAPQVGFEIRLPLRWTQRFLQTGCGGLCGNVRIGADKAAGCAPVTNGEIVLASTDMGHAAGRMGDESWANDPQARTDFAHRGVHVTTLAAKALIRAFYGRPPRFAYFAGCSDGGREALIAAQRYPGDFDGIAAGAPALNFTVQNSVYHGWNALSNTGADGKAILGAADLPTLHAAALKACDALDGLRDAQIDDPRRCRFDPDVLRCADARKVDTCLSVEQIAVVRKFYAGAHDAMGRKLVVGGLQPGSELAWAGVSVPRQPGGAIFSANIALGTLRYLLADQPRPHFQLTDLRFDAATLASFRSARELYDASDAELKPFAQRGGRLILWHGWSDPHISPLNTIDYWARVGARIGATRRDAFARLFLLPAMYHCSGGAGPSDFPLLNALMTWVEGGKAPDRLIATRAAQTQEGLPLPADRLVSQAPTIAARTRPIYPYPRVARYIGKGSIDDAASFAPYTPPRSEDRIDWLGAQ